MTGKTVKLTVGQAIVRYLINQYTTIDGERHQLFAGVFGIFGHGNVTCIGRCVGPSFAASKVIICNSGGL